MYTSSAIIVWFNFVGSTDRQILENSNYCINIRITSPLIIKMANIDTTHVNKSFRVSLINFKSLK